MYQKFCEMVIPATERETSLPTLTTLAQRVVLTGSDLEE